MAIVAIVNLLSKWFLLLFLQHECDRCGIRYQKKSALINHQHRCTYCNNCRRYLDVRHLAKCKGAPLKSEQMRCTVCYKFLTKKCIGRHMRDVHGIQNWSMSQHPDRRTKVRL